MAEQTNLLQLNDQLCFPIYATSRLITRAYQPFLDKLDLTYPQYITMLVLWEKDGIKIGDLGDKIFLKTNTLTPLLKKLESKKLIVRTRSEKDERTVLISLTKKGASLKLKASDIPIELIKSLNMSKEELIQMRTLMWKMLGKFEV
jgi:DNA-binding MarR family transcriptional regulator